MIGNNRQHSQKKRVPHLNLSSKCIGAKELQNYIFREVKLQVKTVVSFTAQGFGQVLKRKQRTFLRGGLILCVLMSISKE